MITSVSLVNIHHHTYLHIFLLLMETFKSCSLSNFQIYNTVLLTIVSMLYITPKDLFTYSRSQGYELGFMEGFVDFFPHTPIFLESTCEIM